MNSGGSDLDNGPNTKVGRLIEKYQLGEEYGAELESAWTAEQSERKSLRELADEINRQLLTTAVNDAKIGTLAGEIDNMYELLTDDDVTSGVRTDARRKLQQKGVDVDQLERDFVTYQAVRSYLHNEREVEYEAVTDEERIKRTVDSINKLRSRFTSVCENNLEQLQSQNQISLGDTYLLVEANVFCEKCGSQYPVSELIERGGCDCE
ncbi:hypothetical protein A4G99_19145 [Haladaptatus sp. R4]|uniref:rod-determining factor RdfA n=1 Tax=Haladaptatus sp. R4 TaxID=1679489 RepID=UPI0007B4A108|nr:rod-determining factor RdfA [Haladaptatus sp. R4]KZN22582.1 hypothetical protein A4G99_19145 [Haladaptatus sp. R4]